jgi:hypothetical protein
MARLNILADRRHRMPTLQRDNQWLERTDVSGTALASVAGNSPPLPHRRSATPLAGIDTLNTTVVLQSTREVVQ